jgi:hypothetical protein
MRRFEALRGRQMYLDRPYFYVLARARGRARARDDFKRGARPGLSG